MATVSQATPPSVQPSPQLMVLGTLVQLEKEARHADSVTALGFIAVNDTHRLLPYEQAVLWTFKPTGGSKVQAVSGVSSIDENAPRIRWLNGLVRFGLRQTDSVKIHALNPEALSTDLQAGWEEWGYNDVLWCPLNHPQHGLIGGLMLARKQPWKEAEMTLAERLLDAYAHAWGALAGKRRKVSLWRHLFWTLVIAGLIALMFVPVHETMLAPAEVVAADPLIISAPYGGVIAAIHIKPNQAVEAGQILFSLDNTAEKNRHLIAQETLAVARAELLSAEQKAFTDARSKSELSLLRARVKEREAEAHYLSDVLQRMEVRAARAGLAVFTDPNDWLGKPVKVGEKVMSLADPKQIEILLQVPVANAINLNPGARVRLFLNTDPTRPHEGELYQAAYEAEPTAQDTLSFRAKARFSGEQPDLRIGLKGTGKIYGEEVPLYYYLFRRPWSTLRQWSGV